MARKSRKNIMPQSAAPEIRISEEVNLLRTAAYARLSSENSGHETEDTLNTQILQIHSYIKEHPGLTLTDTYVDNGFTGTNFDRPEFERMMQDVRTGKIQCIVLRICPALVVTTLKQAPIWKRFFRCCISGLLLSMMILTISGSRMWTVLQFPSRTW